MRVAIHEAVDKADGVVCRCFAAGLMAAEVVDRSARIGHTYWQAGALQKALQQ